MSGSESSAHGNAANPDAASLVSFSVHSLPSPDAVARDPRRTARGRRLMLLVLLVCTAPVVASYLAYFGWRPQSLTNYSELIVPVRTLPARLVMRDLKGDEVKASQSLPGQWLLVVVGAGTCDKTCEHLLWLQRQLHESLGVDKERVDKVWLVDDAAQPRKETLEAIDAAEQGAASPSQATVLRVDHAALAAWLEPQAGHALEDHVYIVDPRGDWMMRSPADPDPAKLKRDVVKLLRASAGWDRGGR